MYNIYLYKNTLRINPKIIWKCHGLAATDNCEDQSGYFRMGDRSNCGQFKNCAFIFNCPEGLAFSEETHRCEWPDMVNDCDVAAFIGFPCPHETRTASANHFNIYRSPSDCQVYCICLAGKPRMHRCK